MGENRDGWFYTGRMWYEQGVSVGKDSVVDSLENAGEQTSQSKEEQWEDYETQIAKQLQSQFKLR